MWVDGSSPHRCEHARVRLRGPEGSNESTHTTDKISNNAAPSDKSATVVTGRERSNVAKYEKKAFSSFFCESTDMMAAGGPDDGVYSSQV